MLKKIFYIITTISISLCCCNIVMGNNTASAYERTLLNELGHIFTLGHSGISFLYSSVMRQMGCGDSNKKSNEADETTDTPKVRIVITDYEPVENISDIEEMSNCVVKAKVLEGKENILYPGYGMGYTKINLEITEVYKGDLKTGDIIPFVERYFIEKDGTEIRRDGYSASEVGKEYVFYLGKLDDGLYDSVCTVLGRYSLDDTESMEANIAEEYAPLYKQLKAEVMNLYQ